MINKVIVENMLKEYCMLKKRASLIKKLQSGEQQPTQPVLASNGRALRTVKGKCTLSGNIQKQNAMINKLVDSVEKKEQEILRLNKSISIIEKALEVLKVSNNIYHKLLVEHFINGVRIEELEEVFDLSRSRCYELRKKALEEITTIIFGTTKSK